MRWSTKKARDGDRAESKFEYIGDGITPTK